MKKERSVLFADLIKQAEPEANQVVSYLMYGVAGMYMLVWLLFLFGLFSVNPIIYPVLAVNAILISLISSFCLAKKGVGKRYRIILFTMMLITVFVFNVLTGYKLWMLFAVPILMTCRYYDKRLTISIGIHCIFLSFLCALCNAYLGPSIRLVDLNVVDYTVPRTLAMRIPLTESIAATPKDRMDLFLGSLKLQFFPNSVVIFIITVMCYVIIEHGQKLIMETKNAAEAKAYLENELAASRTKNMMSQIQPHFIFNTLTAIMAIDGNPEETIEAIATFGRYLRGNLNTISDVDLIDFKREIDHVQVYVSLEQLRFKDKVKIEYDLETIDFKIPSLTVQVLVENAIKHGITKKKEGGTVFIKSCETSSEYLITVEDDGIGFNPAQIAKESNHVGMKNVKARLYLLSKGYLEVQTAVNEGTTAIVHLPKK